MYGAGASDRELYKWLGKAQNRVSESASLRAIFSRDFCLQAPRGRCAKLFSSTKGRGMRGKTAGSL